MWEIFIPEKIFDKIIINTFSEKLMDLIEEHFEILEKNIFKTTHCIWTYVKIKNPQQDLFSLLNWELWNKYFADYDFLKEDFEITWTKILKPEDLNHNIKKISEEFEKIVQELSWNKLLTESKKSEIQDKIKTTFFTIAGILFLLYNIRDKALLNHKELSEYNGMIEYESQAALIWETAKTKSIELSAQIIKFENKSEVFFTTIQKIFL
jgi:hypothetical protein